MGLISNSISRDELKVGDHIYSWRTAYVYSHHGIYVGENKVIHFTSGRGGIWSSSSSFPSRLACPTCRTQQESTHGVESSCLDCFLARGDLNRFQYSVRPTIFFAKRGGTCTFADSDPDEIVVHRTIYLHLHNKGFGCYNLFENNCEDFAIYCKTGLLVVNKGMIRGQACAITGGVAVTATLASISGRLVSATTGVYGMAANAGIYCYSRYIGDIGKRKDVEKVEVEDLHMKLFEEANEVLADWTSEQEYFFINLMLQKVQANGGNMRIDNFSNEEWLDLRVNFYNYFQKKYEMMQFIYKMMQLKKTHGVFKKLMEDGITDGLECDPVLKIVIASDEWWENYLETNPEASSFRNQGFPMYDQLSVIFGDMVAIVIRQASSTPLEGASAPSITRVDGEGRNMQGRSQSHSHTPNGNIRRDNEDSRSSELSDGFHCISEHGQRRIEHNDKYTLSECMDILDAFGSELCDRTYMQALKLLQENGWREAFIRMTDERRKGWLRSIESGDI